MPVSYTATEEAFGIANLLNLISGATKLWYSSLVTATGADDYHVQGSVGYATTAAANSKATFLFVVGAVATDLLADNFGATEAQTDVPDITANAFVGRQIGIIPHTATTSEVVGISAVGIAQAFGGIVPPYWQIGLVNHSGASFSTATGKTSNYWGYRPVKYTT